MKKMILNALIAALVTFLVISCGGSGGDSVEDAHVSRVNGEGIWNATFDQMEADWGTVKPYKDAELIITPDGDAFLRYADNEVAAGKIDITNENRNRASFTGKLTFSSGDNRQATFQGTIKDNKEIDGTIRFPGQSATAITANYSDDKYIIFTDNDINAGNYNDGIVLDNDGKLTHLVAYGPEAFFNGTLERVASRKNLWMITDGTYQATTGLKGYAYMTDEGIVLLEQRTTDQPYRYAIYDAKKFPNDKNFWGIWEVKLNEDEDIKGKLLITPHGRIAFQSDCAHSLGVMKEITGDDDKLKFNVELPMTNATRECADLSHLTRYTATIEDDKISLDSYNTDDVWTGEKDEEFNGFDIVRTYPATTIEIDNNSSVTRDAVINANNTFTVNDVATAGATTTLTGNLIAIDDTENGYMLSNVAQQLSTGNTPNYTGGTGYAIAVENGVVMFVIPSNIQSEAESPYVYYYIAR